MIWSHKVSLEIIISPKLALVYVFIKLIGSISVINWTMTLCLRGWHYGRHRYEI